MADCIMLVNVSSRFWVFKVNAKLVSKPVIGIRSLGEEKESQVAKTVQELVSKRLVKQEGFIDFQINGEEVSSPC